MLNWKSSIHPDDQTSTKASSSTPFKDGSTQTTDRSGRRRSPGGLIKSDHEQSSAYRLWRGVIGQSVRDIYEGDPKARAEVFVWLVSGDFDTVCTLANVHTADMREQMVALSDLPIPLAKKYGRVLREKINEKEP
jgi:hypothetical protein